MIQATCEEFTTNRFGLFASAEKNLSNGKGTLAIRNGNSNCATPGIAFTESGISETASIHTRDKRGTQAMLGRLC